MRGSSAAQLPACQLPYASQPLPSQPSQPSQAPASSRGVGAEHGEEASSDLARHESELSRMEAEQQVHLTLCTPYTPPHPKVPQG